MPKEVAQLDIIWSFMNKRVTAFKDKYGKHGSVLSGKMAQEIKPAQHKLIRELIAQVAIQCGIIGAP